MLRSNQLPCKRRMCASLSVFTVVDGDL